MQPPASSRAYCAPTSGPQRDQAVRQLDFVVRIRERQIEKVDEGAYRTHLQRKRSGANLLHCSSHRYPDGGKKLAVAFSTLQFQDWRQEAMSNKSYIWDVNNPNAPDQALAYHELVTTRLPQRLTSQPNPLLSTPPQRCVCHQELAPSSPLNCLQYNPKASPASRCEGVGTFHHTDWHE